jgi:hypothetical protein
MRVHQNQNLFLSLAQRGELRQVQTERLCNIKKIHVVQPSAQIDHHAPSRALLYVSNHLLLSIGAQLRGNFEVASKNVLS